VGNDARGIGQWISYGVDLLARPVVASLVLYFLVIPLVEVAKVSLSVEMIERAITLTEVTYEKIPNSKAETGRQQAPIPAVGSASLQAEAEADEITGITRRTDSIPRVWAYAIQVTDLLGPFGMTLWAVAVILRRE